MTFSLGKESFCRFELTEKFPFQVLLAEALTSVPIRTFGWSLSGGVDLDGNEYPDLAVGAHETNHAIVFRTRPVVAVNATLM